MSYRCSICEEAVPHGTIHRRHRIVREDGSIAQELAICEACHTGFRSGYTLAQMQRICHPDKVVKKSKVAALPTTVPTPKKIDFKPLTKK